MKEKLAGFMQSDRFRMLQWLVLAFVFYTIAYTFKAGEGNLIGTAFWKAGHVVSGMYLGYTGARCALGRIKDNPTDGSLIARAILMAAAMFTLGFGL